MRPLARLLLGFALLHATPAARADPAVAQAANPHINCTCRANGRSYALGERVCLPAAAGRRVATCRMQENVTSWIIGPDDCAESAATVRPAPARS